LIALKTGHILSIILAIAYSCMASWQDMPLILYPVDTASASIGVVHYSGDAGFNVTDKGFGRGFSAKKIPLVGINSLAYFTKARTPQTAADDLADIIRYFSKAWHVPVWVVSGYSFGADVVPFMVSRLPEDVTPQVRLVLCTSPESYADFSFHVTSWMGMSLNHDYPVVKEIVSLNRSKTVVCFYGGDDGSSCGQELADSLIETHELKRGHRVGGNCDPILDIMIPRVLFLGQSGFKPR
jgi:type IV secretory pathway VirJ component